MAQKIIFPHGDGIAVIHPTGELPIDEVARKDVPAGLPFLIVDDADLPTDRTFRAAWDADFSAPDGTGVGAESWFIEQYQAELAAAEADSPPPVPPEISVQPIDGFSFAAPPEEPDAQPLGAEELTLPEGVAEEDRAAFHEAYLVAFNAEQAVARQTYEAELARWDEARTAAHEQHKKDVAEANRRRLADHAKAEARWRAEHAERVAEISGRIAAMEQQREAQP
jgi:hypothetical protein